MDISRLLMDFEDIYFDFHMQVVDGL
uniref:Uncharacterized protein n=2 Tax=Nymphaea colorata TaxID=210225 RepID=A0A5K0ZGU4_9MAGN|nr:unnamed protein product [Nymphaea colorata]